MVQINPAGNEPVRGKTDLIRENVAKTDNETVWDRWDSLKEGNIGKVDENEVKKFFEDNIDSQSYSKLIVSSQKYNEFLSSMKEFVGKTWSRETVKNMLDVVRSFGDKPANEDLDKNNIDQ